MDPNDLMPDLHGNKSARCSQDMDSSRSSYFRTEFADSELEDSESAIGPPYSDQVVRNIVGQEDSVPKERKKWNRPPLVGQASTSSESSLPIQSNNEESSGSSSEIDNTELTLKQHSERFVKRSDYICEKPPEGGSKSQLPENTEVHRPHTPSEASASSLTSVRPLEWDSGADVGYFQYNVNNPTGDGNLSSLERLALARGTAVLFTRSDPEGTTSTVKQTNQIVSIIGLPDASSTPHNTLSIIKTTSSSSAQSSSRRAASTTGSESPQQPHLFPEVHILNEDHLNDSSSVNSKPSSPNPDNSQTFKNSNSKKLSASLENIKGQIESLAQPSTFPRSQSQSCLQSSSLAHSNLQRILNVAQSHSSSSVSTVVTKTSSPKKKKLVAQTVKPRCSVGTQMSYPLHSESLPENPEECSQKHGLNEECHPSTFEMSSEDRAHSFEYLPGHMYENNIVHVDDTSSETTSHSSHNTIRSEIDKGVALLSEFMRSSKANDKKSKKKLLKRVVERLINSECSRDDISVGMSSDQNYPSHQPFIPEVENDVQSVRDVQNKCVGTCDGASVNNEVSSTISHSATISSSAATFFSSASSKELDSSCDKVFRKPNVKPIEKANEKVFRDWKKPCTRAEKIYEQKKKNAVKSVSETKLLEYLSIERENQLEWIKNEISHLNNLKSLLEEHRVLKKNLSGIKYSKSKQGISRQARSVPSQHLTKLHASEKQTPAGERQSKQTSEASLDSGWDSHVAHPTPTPFRYRRPSKTIDKPTVSKQPSTIVPEKAMSKESVAYTITFQQCDLKGKENVIKEVPTRENGSESPICVIADRNVLKKESRQRITEMYEKQKTLQDELLSKRPDYVIRAENRRQMVAEIAALRELRQNNRKQIIASAIEPEKESDACIPPNPLAIRRIFSQKDMRKQTELKYKQTAQVKNMKTELKKQETYRTNRLMAELFKSKLQRKALRGEVNLSNSVNVISSV